ncbi:hypothetical protein Y032_0055g2535 [Ancylostoma ceylanicum]|uniref:C-type lectin domain-containing protein n=1 Tax=Ancylostoma ceylanicum TaxID=53326 RepID=A0A016U706_9BILA|nr:hypothetical protein Y032_0055g2535 [Ancylostoma ceylanicum]
MVAFFQLLVVMSVLSVSTTHDKIRIREGGWKKFSSFEYKVYSSSENVDFYEAEAYCQNRSAHLVSIHSDEESEFVNNLFGTSRYQTWIGLLGRLMAWTDGSPFDYDWWSYGHPVSGHRSNPAAFRTSDVIVYPDILATMSVLQKQRCTHGLIFLHRNKNAKLETREVPQ